MMRPLARRTAARTKTTTAIFGVVLMLLGVLVAAPAQAAVPAAPAAATGIVKAADLTKFQAGNIISDAVFYNSGTMTEAQIQSFLNSKVSTCRAGYVCLKDKTDTTRAVGADAMCNAYPGGGVESAARIIYKVAQACGINPQALIVMLQKEQGLVTDTYPYDSQYRIAMGQGCPDTAACDSRYFGFFNQVHGAAWQLKRYGNPPGTSNYFNWYAPGKTWNIRWHPEAACGSSPVYIANQATSALYYYTPYQPNAAALRAGYGEGDGCSAYGNRNFYQYFTDWFGSTTDVCAQPPYAQVRSASGLMTATAVAPARAAPNEHCNTDALWLPAGLTVTVNAEWNDWYWVNVGGNMRWMLRSHLTPVDPCSQPPYAEVRGASGAMVTTAALTARSTANAECATGTIAVPAGTRVTLAAEWSDWYWVDINGTRAWVLKNQLTALPDPCTQPPYAEVRGASGTMTTTAAVTARASANIDCVVGAAELAKGARVTVSAEWSNWYWVDHGGTMLWVPKAQLVRAADPCVQPPYEQVRSASGVMAVAASGARAQQAPYADCSAGARSLSAGTRVTVSAQWGDWYWVTADGVHLWVAKSQLMTPADPCRQPPYEQVRGASGVMVVARDTSGRVGADVNCAAGAVAMTGGSKVTLRAEWNDWYWVEMSGSTMWLPKAELAPYDACKQPPYAQVTSASGSYVASSSATLRTGPDDACTSGMVVPPSGAAVTVHAKWTDWHWVEYAGARYWVRATQLAVAQTAACTQPRYEEVRGATGVGVVRAATTATARSAPAASCAAGSVALASGTVVGLAAKWGDWYWIDDAGQMRWVPADQIDVRTEVTTTASVNLRSGPSASAGVVRVLPSGAVLPVLSLRAGWVEVTHQGQPGWISADYIR